MVNVLNALAVTLCVNVDTTQSSLMREKVRLRCGVFELPVRAANRWSNFLCRALLTFCEITFRKRQCHLSPAADKAHTGG
jgi:hypothetical protein